MTDETLTPQDASNADRNTRLLVWIAAGGTLYLLLNLLHFSFGRDQGIFAVVADTFFSGGAPYKDAWDFKTPGIYFVFAAARGIFGESELGFRLFEALTWIIMAAGFALLSRKVGDIRAGVLGFAIATFSLLVNGFWHVGQPESFAAVLVTWAIVLTHMQARGVAQMVIWGGIAVLYAGAGFLKPPLGGGILVSFAWIALATWRAEGGRAVLRPTLAFACGGLGALAALFAWLQLSGAWPAFYDALFVFAPQYTSLGHSDTSLPALMVQAVWKYIVVWPVAAVGIALVFAMEFRNRAMVSVALHILGVMAITFFGVALQAKLFYYHYGLCAALGGLLAGWGYWALWMRVRTYPFALVGVLALIGLLSIVPYEGRQFWKNNVHRLIALVQPGQREAIEVKLYRVHTMETGAIRQTAAWLAENRPDQGDPSVFLWGFEPLVYSYSGLRPHNRFIYNAPMRAAWSKDAAFEEFWAAYDAEQPWAIVVQGSDRLPRVNGDPRDSATVLQEELPRLQAVIDEDYEERTSFESMTIYTLKPSAG